MKVNVLRSLEAQAKGVIGRHDLDPDEVFVFPDVHEGLAFHMRTVPFDICIAFLDRDYEILQVDRMAAETGNAVTPAESVLAVEAAAGYFERHGLKAGMVWQEIANRAMRGEI